MARADVGPNRAVLIQVAQSIEPLLGEIVFVGGQVAELLITAPGATRVRPTYDVDVIVAATTATEYAAVETKLRELGLKNDMSEGAPICRWRTPAGHKLDVMPVDGSILGFASKWFSDAVGTPVSLTLSDELTISIPTAPVYIAIKWDAFLDRGQDDLLGSQDLEDIIAIVAGRPDLLNELENADHELRGWVADATGRFLSNDASSYAIQGALPDAAALPGLVDRVRITFESIAALKD